MSSGNAFAQAKGSGKHTAGPSQEQARPRKRRRLSKDATAAIRSRSAREDTLLEVDIMILDYVAHQAVNKGLGSWQRHTEADPHSLERTLSMADSFLPIFKTHHPSHKPDAHLQFRVQLLRFTTLFTQRMKRGPTSPSLTELQNLRTTNKARAHAWIEEESRIPSLPFTTRIYDSELPLSQAHLQRNRAFVLNDLGLVAGDEQSHQRAFYGTEACVSLLDILPLFMQLSAAWTALSDSNLTASWMSLACEFMLHACLEQYLVCGADGSDAIDEAFAWGHKSEATGVNGDGENKAQTHDEVNIMFEDEEDEQAEVQGWADERSKWLRQLFACDSNGYCENREPDAMSAPDLLSHLQMLARNHSIAKFHDTLLGFLAALGHSIPEPVLHQLENGQLEGMSKGETEKFLGSVGIRGGLSGVFGAAFDPGSHQSDAGQARKP